MGVLGKQATNERKASGHVVGSPESGFGCTLHVGLVARSLDGGGVLLSSSQAGRGVRRLGQPNKRPLRLGSSLVSDLSAFVITAVVRVRL